MLFSQWQGGLTKRGLKNFAYPFLFTTFRILLASKWIMTEVNEGQKLLSLSLTPSPGVFPIHQVGRKEADIKTDIDKQAWHAEMTTLKANKNLLFLVEVLLTP